MTGHADRVDDDGLSREQRRQMELDASTARTDSAVAAIKDTIAANSALTVADIENSRQVEILDRAAGAAVLKKTDAQLTESQRQRNRRVQFRVVRFQPS